MAIFAVTFSAVAVSAAQDLFEINTPAGARVVIREVRFGQYSDAGAVESELISVLMIRAYATSGSGGSAATPVNISGHTGSITPGTTAEVNNTTVASTGSPITLFADAWNVQAPFLWIPTEKEHRIVLEASQRFVVRITAPADAITLNGTLLFEEV